VLGGRTPELPNEPQGTGFAGVIYANIAEPHCTECSARSALRKNGQIGDASAFAVERQRLVGKPEFDALEL
jgi:hypothetical protein